MGRLQPMEGQPPVLAVLLMAESQPRPDVQVESQRLRAEQRAFQLEEALPLPAQPA